MKLNKFNFYRVLSILLVFSFYLSLTLGELEFLTIRINWIFSIIAFLVLILTKLKVDGKILTTFITNPPTIFFFLWLMVALTSTLFVSNTFTFDTIRQIFSINIAIIITGLFISIYKDVKTILISLFAVFLINTVFGYFNIISGIHFIEIDQIHFRYTRYFPSGFYGNPNDFITLIIVSFFASVLLFSQAKNHFLYFMILAFITFPLVIYSDSRAGLLTFFIFSGLYIIFFSFNISSYLYKFKFLYTVFFFFGFLSLIFVYIYFYEYIYYLYLLRFYNDSNFLSDFYRLSSYHKLLNGALQNAFLPNGPGASIVLIRSNAHNIVGELIYDYGIFILFYYLYLLFFFMFTKFTNLKLMNFYIPNAIGLLIISIASSSIIREKIYWVFIFLLYFYQNNRQVKIIRHLKR